MQFVVVIAIALLLGVILKVVKSLNEQTAARTRPMARSDGDGRGPVRQSKSDMDRFLAEIDRLRRKSSDTPAAAKPKKAVPVAPVVQPAKKPERSRARVIAELAEPPPTDLGFSPPPPSQMGAASLPRLADLPVATVVVQPSGTGAPATTVTRFAGRPRPVSKTPLARHLTALMSSGQGLAIAVVLQEILGPRKGKRFG